MRFFRKIRRLFVFQGPTGKYFLYAIGEVMLIVVGVLVALAINNWNEERRSQHILADSLHNLLVNLESDISSLEKLETFNDLIIADVDYSLGLMTLMAAERPPIGQAMDSMFRIGLESAFISTKSAFQSMESGGHFQKLNDQGLLQDIYEYYNFVEVTENAAVTNNRLVSDLLEPFLYRHFELRALPAFGQWMPDDQRPLRGAMPLESMELENLLLVRKFRLLSDNARYDNTKEKALALIQKIRDHLQILG